MAALCITPSFVECLRVRSADSVDLTGWPETRSIVKRDKFPLAFVHQSVVLLEHGLWEGVCLKLATTDYVFKMNMSTSEAPFREQPGITCHNMFPWDGKFEVYGIVFTIFASLNIPHALTRLRLWSSRR